MILVVDANILFSALLKNSLTSELLFEENLKLYTADFIIDEFFKYEQILLKRTHRTRIDFIMMLHQLKEIVTVIPETEYASFIKDAKSISPDEKDMIYFALALKLKCGIWSNDKRLKSQNHIKIYSTAEVANLEKVGHNL